ncbi:MAG: hypothetical protein AB1414_21355 [bacterium]
MEIKKIFAEAESRIPSNDMWVTKSLEKRITSNIYNDTQKTNFEEELMLSKKKYNNL